jgi:hypothetical protein
VTPEEYRAIILAEWARLYLDTGALNSMADGRVDSGLVDRLVAVCEERGVLLVISHAHFQDIVSVDQATRDRLSSLLERFRWRALVIKGPEDLEAEATQAVDIQLALAPNVRALNDASATAASLRTLTTVQGWVHEAQAEFQQLRARDGRVVSRAAVLLGWECLISFFLGPEPAADLATLFEALRQRDGVDVEDWERELTLTYAEPFARLLTRVQTLPGLPDDWKLTGLLNIRAGANTRFDTPAPGQFLATQLNRTFSQNVGRKPQRSDVVDTVHMMHLPYVDVATCDRASFAAVREQLKNVNCRRPVQLFQNGRLNDVLEAVERLRNGNAAMIDRMMLSPSAATDVHR